MKNILNLARKYLPYNKFGDYIVNLLMFYLCFYRLPNKKSVVDLLFQIKTKELGQPLRCYVTDREHVKSYIKAKVGDRYNVPTLKVLKSFQDIDSYVFPKTCIVKSNQHTVPPIFLNKYKNINRNYLKNKFYENAYHWNREINYKNLEPKYIVEPMLFNTFGIYDYKFYCLNGKAKVIHVDMFRYLPHRKRNFYDLNWNKLNIELGFSNTEIKVEKPLCLNDMIDVANILAKDFNFIRIDMYYQKNTFYVGEITNMSECGLLHPTKDIQKLDKVLFS